MPNEVTTVKSNFKSLSEAQTLYVNSIKNGLNSIIGDVSKYQALCGANILSAINLELAKNGLNHLSKGVDRESINNAIKFAMIYSLNTDNREVFVIIRNEKRQYNDEKGQKQFYYIKKIECKEQYKGRLKILASFGRNVKKVYPEWIVREGDDFKYATFKGIDVIPPEWTPKSQDGKVIRVVVPIQYEDGFVDYRIAERESVATNIKAQIKQNVMYSDDGDAILTLIKDMTLDELLTNQTIKKYVNDTYTGLSSEEMIITKLVLNATKRVTIDYSNAFVREIAENTFDNADIYQKSHTAKEIIENEKTMIEMNEPEVQEIAYQEAPKAIETPRKEEKEVSSLFNDVESM